MGNRYQDRTGTYELVAGQVANGMPTWKRQDGDRVRWLYTGMDGKWYLSSEDPHTIKVGGSFATCQGVIASKEPHGGQMPDRVGAWQTWTGSSFRNDTGVSIASRVT